MASNKTALFNMRIAPEIKEAAEELFVRYGLGLSDAVNVFLHQALYEQTFPFELKRRRPARAEVTDEKTAAKSESAENTIL